MRGFARNEEEAELMRQTYIAYQDIVHDQMVRSFPGASSVLGALRRRGTKIAVVTSKRTGIAKRTLECCGLWKAVDLVVCANQVQRPKPHPESVNLALSKLGLEPDGVVFVGDSPFDIQAGKGAGTRTAAALWGPFNPEELLAEGPDFVLDTLRDVLEINPEELGWPDDALS
jgi:pyrophosphatase PpaX|tara:strand:+ start:8342 stop:8857 length:516 start_codon:yes stop_codon:yes gene_type:complete